MFRLRLFTNSEFNSFFIFIMTFTLIYYHHFGNLIKFIMLIIYVVLLTLSLYIYVKNAQRGI